MSYLYCETENIAQFHAGINLNWQPCAAKTESAARAIAQRQRIFKRTIAHVAFVTSAGRIVPLAHRINGRWVESD